MGSFVLLENLLVSLTTSSSGSALGVATEADLGARALAEGGEGSEADVHVGLGADHEGGGIDNALGDTDVATSDEGAGSVDGLAEEHGDAGLQAAVEEGLGGEREEMVQTLLGLVNDAHAREAAQEGSTLEDALGVAVIENEKLTGLGTDGGQHEHGAVDLALVTEAVLADELELAVEALTHPKHLGALSGLALVTVVLNIGYEHTSWRAVAEKQGKGRANVS